MGIGQIAAMNRAIFLDRDGVLNRLVWNPQTGEYESPHRVEDLELYPWTIHALSRLDPGTYSLFLISNQPSFAKGKTTLENIKAIHAGFHQILIDNAIYFTDYYYCYHHPQGVVPGYSDECPCRKPKPFFLLQAQRQYRIALECSWLIGDRDSDIFCGRAAGVKTILIQEPSSSTKRGKSDPDFYAKDLAQAIDIILEKDPL